MADRGPNFQSGALVGPYQKVRKLGEGGMAETYLCVRREPGEPGDPRTRKTTIEDRICCKRLHPSRDERPESRADLEREISILASLRHSNIVQLRGWHLAGRELYCELIDGCDLRQLVTAVPDKKLAAPLVALIGIELCKGLRYAHSRTSKGKRAGIVHRDISPSNVMISYAGEVKLTDFGLAVVVALEQRDGEPLSGVVRGKLAYMAPEQARGDKFADHRVDLFALGVVLYELLAGRRPALGSNDDIYAALSTGQHPPLRDFAPDVPEQLEKIIERLLAPNPAHRYRDADSTIDALTELAPPHNLFRALGELAKQAAPPETLTYAVFGNENVRADESFGSAQLPRRVETPDVTPAPTPVVTTPASDASAPTPSLVDESLLPRPARAPSRLIGVVTVLSVSVAALAALSAANPGGAERVAEAAAVKSADSRAMDIQLSSSAPSPLGAALDQHNEAPPEIEEVGTVQAPVEPQRSAEKPAQEAASQTAALASLKVGVVPIAQVWVDGRYLGWSWSPINVKLDPDVEHVVAAGESKAEVRQAVRLTAGERRAITLHLPKPKAE